MHSDVCSRCKFATTLYSCPVKFIRVNKLNIFFKVFHKFWSVRFRISGKFGKKCFFWITSNVCNSLHCFSHREGASLILSRPPSILPKCCGTSSHRTTNYNIATIPLLLCIKSCSNRRCEGWEAGGWGEEDGGLIVFQTTVLNLIV